MFLDRVVNLLDEGVDAAVRIGSLPDSTMQAIRVGHARRVICAAHEYLAQHGIPQTPDDLQQHTIVSANSVTPNPEWRLMKKGEPVNVRVQACMTTSAQRVRAFLDLAIERLRQEPALNG
jgi:DNA-binding transcriptional LysR family regulator